METSLEIAIEDGKYTIILTKEGNLYALRYGEKWRDCCGDGLILAMAQEIQFLKMELNDLSARTSESYE